MQVQNNARASQPRMEEKPVDLKQGDLVKATIVEQKSSTEATVRVRGKEFQAKFEGGVPQGNQATVEVKAVKDGILEVKAVADVRVNTPVTQPVQPSNIGVSSSANEAFRQAVQILVDKGIPLTKEGIADLKVFFEKANGSLQDKLDTVQALANKRLELTAVHLRMVHEALNGKQISAVLDGLTQEGRQSAIPTKDSSIISSELVKEILGQVQASSATRNTEGKQQGSPADLLKMIRAQIQQEPSLQKVIDLVQSQLDGELANQLGDALDQAKQYQQKGREIAARQILDQGLQELEQKASKDVVTNSPNSPNEEVSHYDFNDDFQRAIQLQSKDLLVTTITKKLSELATNFKDVKRDITKSLDVIDHLIQQKNQTQPKQLLESTIKKLDNLILRSEMMLFTDMKTEKQLMMASSQLADARKMLSNGNHSGAHQIVSNIKEMLEKLEWKPSDTKVKHFIMGEKEKLEQTQPIKQLLTQIDKVTKPFNDQDATARQMFETIRKLGLNHDSELAQNLVFNDGKNSKDQQQQNLKSTLMQMLQGESDQQGKVYQHAEQALANITGQQLLSKSDSSSLQSLFFNLPLMLGEKIENLQVLVNSRNEGQKVDWEHCSLYFLLETKKLGEVGIMVSAVDRKLSITVKNDKQDFKEKMSPLAEKAKERLNEIGYQTSSIHFTKMTQESPQTKQGATLSLDKNKDAHNTSMRGWDFKI